MFTQIGVIGALLPGELFLLCDCFLSCSFTMLIGLSFSSLCSMTGGRLNRFNIVKQSKDYDFGGDYVRLWCPELNDVPDKYVHEPWNMSESLMEECGVKIGPGRDYPSPIVNPNVQPRIMNNGGGGRGGRGRGRGGKGGRGNGRNGQRRDNKNNPNRGKGQRQDMKSLKKGTYTFTLD